ncbi:MAG: hypothetical protein ACR2OO_16925, partial [Thermomicrobiales bacterium]
FPFPGTPPTASEPEVDETGTRKEMARESSPALVTTGPKRWRMVNAGALVHEMAMLPLPAGTTEGQFGEYLTWTFSQPFDATPIPDATPPGGLALDYAPVAAMSLLSPGRTSWVDIDLPPGRYGALCAVPDGPPHAAQGMYAVFDVV